MWALCVLKRGTFGPLGASTGWAPSGIVIFASSVAGGYPRLLRGDTASHDHPLQRGRSILPGLYSG